MTKPQARIYPDWLPATDDNYWIGRIVAVTPEYEEWYRSGDLKPDPMFNSNPIKVIDVKPVGFQGRCARCEWEHEPRRIGEVIRAWIPLRYLRVIQ